MISFLLPIYDKISLNYSLRDYCLDCLKLITHSEFQSLCHPQKIMVFCLENGVRIVTTKKGKRKRMIACYFSKIITLFMQSFFLPAQPQKLKRNECVSLSLLWAFDQLTHMINKMKFFKWSTPGGGGWGYSL